MYWATAMALGNLNFSDRWGPERRTTERAYLN